MGLYDDWKTAHPDADEKESANVEFVLKQIDKVGNASGAIGNSSTAAATATKVVTIPSLPAYSVVNVIPTGTKIGVTFSIANTATTVATVNTLDVNNSGAKETWCNGMRMTGTYTFVPGFLYIFEYDGEKWQWTNPIDTIHCVSTTAAATAVKISSTAAGANRPNKFTLYDGCIINVTFTIANTSITDISLNINNTGAKPIYYENAKVTGITNLWAANETISFQYDASLESGNGAYRIISGLKKIPPIGTIISLYQQNSVTDNKAALSNYYGGEWIPYPTQEGDRNRRVVNNTAWPLIPPLLSISVSILTTNRTLITSDILPAGTKLNRRR